MRRDFWELIQFFPISRFARGLCVFCKIVLRIFFFDEIGVRVRKFFLLEEVLRRVSAAAIK